MVSLKKKGDCKVHFPNARYCNTFPPNTKTFYKPRPCVNISCFLEINQEDNMSKCKDCIETLVEETWTCDHLSSALVFNQICSVEYNLMEPRLPKKGLTFLEIFGIVALSICVVGCLACSIIVAVCYVKRDNQSTNDDQTMELRKVSASPTITSNHSNSPNILDSLNNQVIIDAGWLQLDNLPLGRGHFGSVYKGTLKLPDSDTVYLVAIKRLRIRTSSIGKY